MKSGAGKRTYDWKCVVKDCDESTKNKNDPKYQLFPFPRPESTKQIWLENVNLGPDFKPTKYTCVCGKHFPDGHPTTQNPYPELLLGWECPYKARFQPIRDDITRPTARNLADRVQESREARRLLGLPDVLTEEEATIQSQYKIPTVSSYSDYCSVVGCPNSAYVLKKLGSVCRCPLFPIPKNVELAKKWSDFAQLNIIYSSKRGQICSWHFVDGEPTVENPLPTIYPGFDEQDTSDDQEDVDDAVPVSQPVKKFKPNQSKNTTTAQQKNTMESSYSVTSDDGQCRRLTGLSSKQFNELYDDVKESSQKMLVAKFDPDTKVCYCLLPHSCLTVTLIKINCLMCDTELASMFGVNAIAIREALKMWIPFVANHLSSYITWPIEEEIIDPEKAVIMKRLGNDKVVGILDCVKIETCEDVMHFVVVYNLSGAVIYLSQVYFNYVSENDVVLEVFEPFLKPLLKVDEILLCSRPFGGNVNKLLKIPPTVNLRKAICRFYESRLKTFATISKCAEIPPLYPNDSFDIIKICCGLICLMPPVEFTDEPSA